MAGADLPFPRFWDLPLADLLASLDASWDGLSQEQAEERLHHYGANVLTPEHRLAEAFNLLRLLGNPLILILVGASAIALALGDHVSGMIIIAMVLLSVLLNFLMEFRARRAVASIREQVATSASVIRDGTHREIPAADLVPGDIIRLEAGDLIPADARLLESKDLHVRESALTGESLPVEKHATALPPTKSHSIIEALNSVFHGTAVQSGIATAVVVRTGQLTTFGEVGHQLASKVPETEFDRGIRRFGIMIMRIVMFLVLFVLLVNLLFRRPLLDSFLFAMALAVGMTPELMPMIITVTLAQAARRMMRRKVLVKQLAAIENFGSIEILCSDKTGTLTAGEVSLERHVDFSGHDDQEVLNLAYLNSSLQTGIRSALDDAILKHGSSALSEYHKIDELPFDFSRRRLSVAVAHDDLRLLVTKGDGESVLGICTKVLSRGTAHDLDATKRLAALRTLQELGNAGFRTLGIALRTLPAQAAYETDMEADMTFAGFAAFLDPPRDNVPSALKSLAKNGITITIMTGDNAHVTRTIAAQVGLKRRSFLGGDAVDAMDDAALAVQAARGAIFTRVTPEQKNRIIIALKMRGHVVGYLGDGINDAPSLHSADVGISVMNGVEVAKNAAGIILLEKDLAVLNEGVLEGRRCYANIMKYIVMGTSSNFGNMFSMAGASLFLPFLPMLPMQVLLNNLLYDLSQVALPSDRVDAALMHRPKRWQVAFIRQFMMVIGPISSLYDFAIFAILLWGFDGWHNSTLFHTGWFVESLATQALVVFVIRTAAHPLKSRPAPMLVFAVLAVVAAAILLPYTPLGPLLGFTPLPAALLGLIAMLIGTYLVLVQVVKSWFYHRHALL